MSIDDVISSALRTGWHRPVVDISVLPTGLLSRAFTVSAGGELLIARLVRPAERVSLEVGSVAAEHLRERGLAIGRPVRTLTGGLTAETPAGVLSVLRRVPGRALDGADPVDQQWWGDRLGAAHRALAGFSHPGLRQWNWLDVDAPHLGAEPWLRPAVTDAVTAMTRLLVTDRLTYGVLHGDPAAGDFVVDPATGRAGMFDWRGCGIGPLVYDVAAAVVYAGGPERATEFIDGYLAAGPVGRDELDAALPVLLRFRWAVQADWLARGLAPAASPAAASPPDVTPVVDESRAALRHARVMLEAMAAGDAA